MKDLSLEERIKSATLTPEQLRWSCPQELLDEILSEKIEPAIATIGQQRALDALEMGIKINSPGYNIYVAGLVGTGKTSAVKRILETIKMETCPLLRDYCYVYNFQDPERPNLLVLPAGSAKKFARDMDNIISTLRKDIPSILESEQFQTQRKALITQATNEETKIMQEFEDKAREKGFALVQVKTETMVLPDVIPVIEGHLVPLQQLRELVQQGKMSEEKFREIVEQQETLKDELEKVLQRVTRNAQKLKKQLSELEQTCCGRIIDALIDELKSTYRFEEVQSYLDQVRKDLYENLNIFKPGTQEAIPAPLSIPLKKLDPFRKYSVNVLIDNSGKTTFPVVFENSPTYTNLFGTIEYEVLPLGAVQTDFSQIKAGSILRANNGFLVLQAREVFMNPGVWPALKKVLLTQKLEIQPPPNIYPGIGVAIKPEPIDISLKVIMIGDSWLYDFLYLYEEDFRKIFKIKAEFDNQMVLNKENLRHFIAVLHKICKEEGLSDFDKSGIASVIEYAVKRAGDRGKISTRFNEIADLTREASFWAKQAQSPFITREYVQKALDEINKRHNLIENRLQEAIEKGLINIQVSGEVVGQVNGLSVYDMGLYAFGKPSRITASTSIGKSGIINIEREAGLSGKIHDKGVMIISGFLRERYAKNFPLSLSASICFEQSYAGVEGDSASSTEIYALLSSLSNIPIKQGIAVTGSVDQKGNIQPVGGVNYKIEGFFDVCKAKGLTGEQGVIIPRKNVDSLMLKDEVIQAVKEGKFHIWAVDNVDQGIEILTGREAGELKDGNYPPGTINYLVQENLYKMAQRLAAFEKGSFEGI